MITPRLEMILRNISGKTVADIGTDHAYIPIFLSQHGVRVIATDISAGPLAAAKKNAEKTNSRIELRLGGGLSPLSCGEVEDIIIAGMGGEMIEKILSENMEIAKKSTLILQPMNSQSELRAFLFSNGFTITREDLSLEGFKLYNLIVCKFTGCPQHFREIDLHLPPLLYTHELFGNLTEKKKREFNKIYTGLCLSKSQNHQETEKYKHLLDELSIIERENLK